MKAAIVEKYGSPNEVVEIRTIEKPSPKGREVLVKIGAASLNDYDWSLVRGKPYVYRLMFGLRKPKHGVLGMELSGTVAEVGPEVEQLKAGDRVFGDTSDHGFGSLAEYVCIDEHALRKMPEEMSFEQAAALPHASTLAMQGLVTLGKIQKGQRVLINGGGGGVGTLGLQIAKSYNCEVTGVDSAEKFKTMKDLGFDKLIDYRKENFTRSGLTYDLILDCKSNQSVFSYRKALSPQGRYISIGGKLGSLFNILILGKFFSFFSKKRFQVLSLKVNGGLEENAALHINNSLTCLIDGPYPLEYTGKYLQYFGEGRHKGKVIIKPSL